MKSIVLPSDQVSESLQELKLLIEQCEAMVGLNQNTAEVRAEIDRLVDRLEIPRVHSITSEQELTITMGDRKLLIAELPNADQLIIGKSFLLKAGHSLLEALFAYELMNQATRRMRLAGEFAEKRASQTEELSVLATS